MQNIGPEELERKIQQVLERKKEELYREFRDRMGLAVIEDRNTGLLERMVRIEEEIKSHRILTENLIHQMDRRFEQVDKRFALITWVVGGGFTLVISILVTVLNAVLK